MQEQGKTLAEILQEELESIQDLLGFGDMLIIQPRDIRLELMGEPVAIGSQATAAILENRYADKD
jgi:hypothetical protein